MNHVRSALLLGHSPRGSVDATRERGPLQLQRVANIPWLASVEAGEIPAHRRRMKDVRLTQVFSISREIVRFGKPETDLI